jgi:hypothetical protein
MYGFYGFIDIMVFLVWIFGIFSMVFSMDIVFFSMDFLAF